MSITERSASSRSQRATRSPTLIGPARNSHVRIDSWSVQSPMTLCKKRYVPSTPRSLLKPALARLFTHDGRLQLHAHERPRTTRDVGEVRVARGHRDHRRRGVVTRDVDHFDWFVRAESFGEGVAHRIPSR